MKVSLPKMIIPMVEALLPPFSKGKALHLVLSISYGFHIPFEIELVRQTTVSPDPEEEKELSECEFDDVIFDEMAESRIGSSMQLHLIFHRSHQKIRVLWKLAERCYLYPADGPHLFEQCGYHDSEWRSGLSDVLNKLHRDSLESLAAEYIDRTGMHFPDTERLLQPNTFNFGFCGNDGIKLIDTELTTMSAYGDPGDPSFDLQITYEEQPDDQPRKTIWTLNEIQ